MKNPTLQQDQIDRPELFLWNGPIELESILAWEAQSGFHLSPDVRTLIHRTGGGEMFEGEVILAPLRPDASGESLDATRRLFLERGMPSDWVVFHVGGVRWNSLGAEAGEIRGFRF